jgi:hypothetical protein
MGRKKLNRTKEELDELNEQILLNKGKVVTLVRPGFGTISDAITGQLDIFTEKYPITFQVSSIGMSTIFTIDDVEKLVDLFIYLKGPTGRVGTPSA